MRSSPISEPCRRLGGVIRYRRHRLGYSQAKLAELAGCHDNHIGFIERGVHNLSVDLLIRLASALNTTVASLLRSAKIN